MNADTDIALPALLQDDARTIAERATDAFAGCGETRLPNPAWLRVFTISPFVAEIAIRRPAEFLALVEQADTPRSADNYRRLLDDALADVTDPAVAKTALRRLRQLEMCRIAWRDIHLGIDVHTIMAELSAFADSVLRAAVAWTAENLTPRYGRACAADGTPLELAVIAMGKLGGGELNFSSDIDLIFVYGADGTTRGGRREFTHQEYFDRLGRECIALLNETTADGQVFRVDMRLRPFGDSGPLTASLSALENYYAAHGRDWERYALIKSRTVTGDPATRAALAELIRPFVFRRYLDYGALDALREMKTLIDREARSNALANDVKRGPGGIREIEFTAQLFQLTRGGREARLRQQALVPTLTACAELGLLEPAAVTQLLGAYAFLRQTEHRLQQVNDWQTHALPEDANGRARLAFAMGAADWTAFMTLLDAQRAAVRTLFAGLLEAPAAPTDTARRNRFRDLWLDPGNPGNPDDPATLGAAAAGCGLELDEAALAVVAELKSERFLHRFSRAGRERLDRLMPLVFEHLHYHRCGTATVKRLSDLLHAIARRSVYLAFLADNPDAIARLLQLFDASPWIAAEIVAHPLLLDELLDPRVLYAPPDRARLGELVAHQVRAEDGLEQAMENLRAFRNQQVLRVAASDVTDHLPVADVSNQLSYIAEACVCAALEVAWRELTARFGAPGCIDQDGHRSAGFGVIAYGKLGGYELGYGSDLDLVFLHDSSGSEQVTDGEKVIENEVFFTRLVQRFIHILSTVTATGKAYEVDTRLRPSGTAGLLVSGTTAFRDYVERDAWVWEHQALVRARAVAGTPAVCARFAAIREAALARARDADQLRQEIITMRERMQAERDHSDAATFDLKHGRGGITDIEFMVQYAVLAGAAANPQLLAWTDNLRLLETIAGLQLLPAAACRELHDAYFAYRAEIHRCALQQTEARVAVDRFRDHRAQVIGIWKNVFEQP